MLTSVRGIELRQVPDPVIHFPADAVVTVTASCVCGSDLHGYRGHAATAFPRRIGHEFIGVVSDTGSAVTTVRPGDLVIAARVMDLLAGAGADCTLECVGTQDSLDQAVAVTRPGGMLGCVGAPFYNVPAPRLAGANIGLRGGVAPVRAYLPGLLDDVLARVIHPGKVFDLELPLADVAEGYRAMDERRAVKVLLRP
jgi:threonine dehydrogenase-like Zn-dependent dehydrogenase